MKTLRPAFTTKTIEKSRALLGGVGYRFQFLILPTCREFVVSAIQNVPDHYLELLECEFIRPF